MKNSQGLNSQVCPRFCQHRESVWPTQDVWEKQKRDYLWVVFSTSGTLFFLFIRNDGISKFPTISFLVWFWNFDWFVSRIVGRTCWFVGFLTTRMRSCRFRSLVFVLCNYNNNSVPILSQLETICLLSAALRQPIMFCYGLFLFFFNSPFVLRNYPTDSHQIFRNCVFWCSLNNPVVLKFFWRHLAEKNVKNSKNLVKISRVDSDFWQ